MIKTLATMALFSSAAFSAVIFQDNFDTTFPATQLNADLPNWLEENGTIDYNRNGDFGVTCLLSSAGCIDLDGSTNDAGDLRSAQSFNLRAGFIYELSFWFSGNQRNTGTDSMTVSFGGIDVPFPNVSGFQPFVQVTIQVIPVADTTSDILFSHAGGDLAGIILDDVRLTETVIPEPSTFALMALALGGAAAVRRRRA